MAKTFIPQVGFKDIDLAQYGGEGIVRVRGMSSGTTTALSERLQKLAIADGYKLAEIPNKMEEINFRYNSKAILFAVELCGEIEDDEGFRKLTKFEVENMPPVLLMDMYDAIRELNEFPLAQPNGEESKKEQLKPLSVE